MIPPRYIFYQGRSFSWYTKKLNRQMCKSNLVVQTRNLVCTHPIESHLMALQAIKEILTNENR